MKKDKEDILDIIEAVLTVVIHVLIGLILFVGLLILFSFARSNIVIIGCIGGVIVIGFILYVLYIMYESALEEIKDRRETRR